MKAKFKPSKILGLIGWIAAIITLFPMYIMVVNSFKGRAEIFTDTMGLPKSLYFSYYLKAMEKMNFTKALFNSLIITVSSIVLIIIFSSMTAWVLVRNKSKLSDGIFYLFVATMLVPFQSLMIPLMQYMSGWEIKAINFSMIDTYYGLIFMYIGFGMSLSVFLYHGFIKGVPRSLEEAAMIDGCNKFQVFWRIVFPTLKPITVTVAILNVIWIWNDYLLPSLVLRSPDLRTIPLSTFYFFGEFTIQWNLAMAGLVLTIIPIIIFYLFSQRYIIKGVMAGAIK
ncbi:carbohydrate ABC transporter membrane protein 2, CUT1 family [Clostridium amylolyticum]|uniref:Carbohydrate ABC transporter membrane protein 2, CUT1 family n=1 Tax=Clostridium amylolyticum TaxID=1121298 RepID=A0A1M6HDM2_9CLOT|nr:carbohydrate ABC transporter permease [Clostridium amylolyticum]SHJ20259.1 carbohydrate ABC transporter membrane protein 2, CUT1 family [Clostridium amylolyticum]